MKSRLAAISAAMTIVLTGAMAGLYYAFSVSVMPGFDKIEASQAIPAMQSINREIENPVFFLTFFGAPVAAFVTGGLLRSLGQKRAGNLFLLGGANYVLGSLIPTIAVNVPMNDDLGATAVPSGPAEAARVWSDFSGRWTAWNTVRTVFTTLSLLCAGWATYLWGKQELKAARPKSTAAPESTGFETGSLRQPSSVE